MLKTHYIICGTGLEILLLNLNANLHPSVWDSSLFLIMFLIYVGWVNSQGWLKPKDCQVRWNISLLKDGTILRISHREAYPSFQNNCLICRNNFWGNSMQLSRAKFSTADAALMYFNYFENDSITPRQGLTGGKVVSRVDV